MATTAVSLQPLEPAASTSLENSGTRTGTDTATLIGSTSQTPVSGYTKSKGEVHGFGILQHTGPPVQDDVLGLYRDGRVRNPVPSKLKGKTDARKGNFGVMHIDLSTTNETQERDAAAKRTSEGTQLAAKLAQTDRYVPIKRSKFVYRPEDQAAPSSQQPDGARQRTSPLTVAETKAEQARLLTLLRSLQPVLVVDQLCKALAFFGEVSSAQSSADRVFPVSAEANGSGSLFVGWLAEIFPALGQGSLPSAEHPLLKRPRGRPKGSKNAKGKKDKLAKKRFGPAAPSANATGDSHASSGLVGEPAVDDSWVDVDDDVVENEGELLEEQPVRNPTTPSLNNRVASPSASGSVLGSAFVKAATATPTPKRRGRPKGSKNRPKHKTMLTDNTQVARDMSSATIGSNVLPNAMTDVAGSSAISIPSNASTGPVEPGMLGVRKRKPGPGRPKGSKNRPKEVAPASQHDLQLKRALTNIDHQRKGVPSSAVEDASEPSPGIAINPPVQTEPQQEPRNTGATILPTSVSEPVKEAVAVKSNAGGVSMGIKRKRKALQEGNTTKPDDVPSSVAPVPVEKPAEAVPAVAAVASQSDSSPQLTGYYGTPNQGSTQAYKSAKRQRVSTELQQERALNGHIGQVIQPESHTPQPDALADHYDVDLGRADRSNLQRSRNQMSISSSRSTLQQTVPNAPIGYSRNIVAPGTGQQAERPKTMGPYTMNIPGGTAQGIYNQVRPAQQQQQQLHQQKLQRQLSPSHNQPNSNQHYLATPNAGQTTSTAGQDGSSFTASTSDGGYHGLTSIQQPSFNAEMAVVPTTVHEANYRGSTSRPLQHRSPAFQRRQAHRSQNSDLSSFHNYPESAFLEMAGLDSPSQASLNMNSTSYNINGGNMQRASSNINSSYDPASSMGQPSFDGGITESALRDRVYHPLRRQ